MLRIICFGAGLIEQAAIKVIKVVSYCCDYSMNVTLLIKNHVTYFITISTDLS